MYVCVFNCTESDFGDNEDGLEPEDRKTFSKLLVTVLDSPDKL